MTSLVTQSLSSHARPARGDHPVAARLGSVVTRAGRDLLYLALGLLTSILAFGVWVAGLSVSLSLAVFLVGLPIILASAVAFRWTAELDRRNAALVRGRALRGRYRDQSGKRFLARLSSTLGDPQTWKDLAWLVLHSLIGFSFGVVALSLVGTILGVATLPAWYWALPDGAQFGLWTGDTLPKAVASALLALPAAVVTVGVLRAMALGEAGLAAVLLDDRQSPATN